MAEVATRRKRGEDSFHYKQSRGCYEAQCSFTIDGERYRPSATGTTEEEALKNLQRKKREIIKSGKIEKRIFHTFSDVMDMLMLSIQGTIQDKSYSDLEYRVSILKSYPIAGKKLDKIDETYIQQTINQITVDKGFSESTCTKLIAFVKRVFRFAVSKRIIGFNPVSENNSIKMPVEAKEANDIQPLSSNELKCLFDVLEGAPRLKPIVFCMFFAGLRIGEVLALTWDKLDFDNNTININCAVKKYKAKEDSGKKHEFKIGPPKTKQSVRILPMSQNLRECLLDWKNKQIFYAKDKTGMGLVFPKRTGSLQDYDSYNIGFNKYLAKLNIDYHIYHSRAFRHTFASYAIKKNVHIKTLQKLMGHSNVETTLKYYVDTDLASQHEAINKIDFTFENLDSAFIFTNVKQFLISKEKAS